MTQNLISRRDGPVEYLTLNRPEVRNALNDEVIEAMTAWAESVERAPRPRVAVLSGNGPVFCAGADMNWFLKTARYTAERNEADAAALSRLFVALDRLPVPLIGCVHGAALGGGAGIAAVCDIVVCAADTVFGFTEVKLGIVPAVISPFVLAKIGRSAARELFLTGTRFSADRAREIGLVHAVVPPQEVERTVARYVSDVLSSAPEAVAAAKALIGVVSEQTVDAAMPIVAQAIATRRASPEADEGLRAFLEKRKPSWTSQ